MIKFELSLTTNQIAALKLVADEMAFKDHEEKRPARNHMRCWLLSVAALLTEKLVTHTPRTREECAAGRKHWEITEKGRLVLKLIEMEVSEWTQEMIGEAPRPVLPPRRKRGAAPGNGSHGPAKRPAPRTRPGS